MCRSYLWNPDMPGFWPRVLPEDIFGKMALKSLNNGVRSISYIQLFVCLIEVNHININILFATSRCLMHIAYSLWSNKKMDYWLDKILQRITTIVSFFCLLHWWTLLTYDVLYVLNCDLQSLKNCCLFANRTMQDNQYILRTMSTNLLRKKISSELCILHLPTSLPK